jgi:peptidoglycan/xylan/chitin deacetylase (PgdA/CDA1 family)
VFKTDKDEWIKKENYLSYPKRSIVLCSENNNDDKSVALTFDDGPDPLYTSRILDILKQSYS